MRTLFTGPMYVHYGQFYVESGDAFADADLGNAFAGQANGICGGATPGVLALITGLHTGDVALRVEAAEGEPELDPSWEDVVEVSFAPRGPVRLVQWAAGASFALDLPATDYRVRYCARGMDDGRDADTLLDGEPTVDSYLLQFWPAPAAPDAVVRQTSDAAGYFATAWR